MGRSDLMGPRASLLQDLGLYSKGCQKSRKEFQQKQLGQMCVLEKFPIVG